MGKIIRLWDSESGQTAVQKPSFETVYETYYTSVLSYIRKKITNLQDAEDLTSEIFLYCYDHYADYDPAKSAVSTWLYLVTNSRIKNYYRDHVTFADYETVSETMQDHSIDLDEGIYLEQLHGALMKAIATLPERQQMIVIMRYFQNCSGEEIAKRLGITPGNVRVLLSRALNKLSALNEGYWKEFTNNG